MKDCFIISPIGENGSETRKRSDLVLKYIIEPALKECEYTPVRADMIPEAGLITSQIIQRIIDSPLVIADLTDSNPNVFYELAIRHAVKKPLIQLLRKGDRLPFDVAGMRTIPVETDLESAESARTEIIRQIRNVETKRPDEIESPVSMVLSLQKLNSSDDAHDRSMASWISIAEELRFQISDIDRKISDPSKLLPPEYVKNLFQKHTSNANKEMCYFNNEIERILIMVESIALDPIDDKTNSTDKNLLVKELRDRVKSLRQESGKIPLFSDD